MEKQLTKAIDVLIIEDDLYYNNLLAQRLKNMNHDPKINLEYQVRIRQVVDPDEYLENADPSKEKDRQTIAFIDYFLGKGYSGVELSSKILALNEQAKIVIMSQSEETIEYLEKVKPENNLYTNLLKHEFTPEICCIIVENYIKNL